MVPWTRKEQLQRIRNYLLGLPRGIKQALMISADLCGALVALFMALLLQGAPLQTAVQPLWQTPVMLAAVVVFAAQFGLYTTVIRHIGVRASFKILNAALATAVLLALVGLVFPAPLLQPTLVANFSITLAGILALTRIVARHGLGSATDSDAERLVIFGAGNAGVQLVQALASDRRRRVVAFIDDDRSVTGSTVADLPVHASTQLPALIGKQAISGVLLALPTATRQRKQELLDWLEPLPVTVKTVPSLRDILAGQAQITDIRGIDIEDLLGRDPVPPDPTLLSRNIDGQTVMVTGAGGSIGSELCRQIVALNPARLILFETSEVALFRIDQELIQWADKNQVDARVIPILGNVLDRHLVATSIQRFGVDTLYHAAAYKHVPLVEHNVSAGLRNNVIGTYNVAEAAAAQNVKRFILISTDKAVRPTNVMGATKRVAEQVVQGLAARSNAANGHRCIFSMVRFGNVLGSSGSVVPQFREQIRNGGPVTVTHPDITRYFMTIPEAAQLVIQAGAMAKGGDVFVLDMGEPVRIVDLARRMIRLAGHTVRDDNNAAGNIEITFTGLRPGEKLYEELLIASSSIGTGHSKIGCAEESALPWPQLESLLQEMVQAADRYKRGQLKQLLQQAVPEYAAAAQDYDAISSDADQDTEQSGHSNVVPLQ